MILLGQRWLGLVEIGRKKAELEIQELELKKSMNLQESLKNSAHDDCGNLADNIGNTADNEEVVFNLTLYSCS